MVTTDTKQKRIGADIDLTAIDGHVLKAYLAKPIDSARGAVVVAQDAYGLGDYIRSVCDSYARDGYVAIAPAIYNRQERNAVFDHSPDSQVMARRLRAGLVWDLVLADVKAAFDQVKAAGRVGIVGFCVGGSITWLAVASLPFSCASAYYGKDIVDWLDQNPRSPIILHFGNQDRLISIEDVEKIRTAYPDIPIYVYPAGHGFDNREAQCAQLARQRTLAFFQNHIG